MNNKNTFEIKCKKEDIMKLQKTMYIDYEKYPSKEIKDESN